MMVQKNIRALFGIIKRRQVGHHADITGLTDKVPQLGELVILEKFLNYRLGILLISRSQENRLIEKFGMGEIREHNQVR